MPKLTRPPFTKSWRADLRYIDRVWMADFRGPNIAPALSDSEVVGFETEILETIAEAQEKEARYCLILHGRGRRRKGESTRGAFINGFLRCGGMWQWIKLSQCRRYDDAVLVAIRPLLEPQEWDKLSAKADRAQSLSSR